MKTDDQKDESLRRTLNLWRVETPLPPRFEDGVWRRIERGESTQSASVWASLQNAVQNLLARPRLAYSYLTLALAVGIVVGGLQARARASQIDSSLQQRYVQSVDPYHKPGHL